MISAADFQSYMGPGDKNLPNSEVMGYQPVSRIGEVVMVRRFFAFSHASPCTKHTN